MKRVLLIMVTLLCLGGSATAGADLVTPGPKPPPGPPPTEEPSSRGCNRQQTSQALVLLLLALGLCAATRMARRRPA